MKFEEIPKCKEKIKIELKEQIILMEKCIYCEGKERYCGFYRNPELENRK